MKAIRTRFFGPTDTKGSRVQATDGTTVRYFEWNHEWDGEKNHRNAAMLFIMSRAVTWAVPNQVHITSWFKGDGYHCWVTML